MKIIGHRGAAGLAPENTLEAIQAAIKVGIDGIEIDVRVTKDSQLVLCHDASLQRTHGVNQKIADSTLASLRTATAQQNHPVPTLDEALQAVGTIPLFIEAKGSGWAIPLAKLLKTKPINSSCTVIAFNHHELFNFGQKCPNVPLYGLERHNPMEAIQNARIFGFEGIDLNYWILNPLVYWLSRRHKLSVVVYTVNKPWMARFLQLFYPNISITTDNPDKMQFIRPRLLRGNKKARA